MGDFDENEFYYEDEEFGEDGPTPEQILAMKIRAAKAAAPHEDRKGRIKYPDGTVVNPVELKDRSGEDKKQLEKEIKDKWDKKKQKKLTREEVESKVDVEKRKREYRNNLIKYAKAKVDCEMDKFDLYIDPAKVEVENERFWEMEPHLGEEKKVG